MRTFYDSVLASVIFYQVVFWNSSISDRKRLSTVIKRVHSVMFVKKIITCGMGLLISLMVFFNLISLNLQHILGLLPDTINLIGGQRLWVRLATVSG